MFEKVKAFTRTRKFKFGLLAVVVLMTVTAVYRTWQGLPLVG